LTSQSTSVPFIWTEVEQEAFQELKRIITEDVMLTFPDPDKPFNITTDASDYGIGAVLSQTEEVEGTQLERPIMFVSSALTDTQERYTVTEKELYAIIYALKKFKPYIYGRKFSIFTDHRALIWLCGKRDPVSRLGRWSEQISGVCTECVICVRKEQSSG